MKAFTLQVETNFKITAVIIIINNINFILDSLKSHRPGIIHIGMVSTEQT